MRNDARSNLLRFAIRLLPAALGVAAFARGTASAATLHGGDVIVLGSISQFNAGDDELFIVTPATHALQHAMLSPPVTSSRDLVVLHDGTLLVSEAVHGLLRVNPDDGSRQVQAGGGVLR